MSAKPVKASGQYAPPGVPCTQLCRLGYASLLLIFASEAKSPQITPRVARDQLQAR